MCIRDRTYRGEKFRKKLRKKLRIAQKLSFVAFRRDEVLTPARKARSNADSPRTLPKGTAKLLLKMCEYPPTFAVKNFAIKPVRSGLSLTDQREIWSQG